MEDEQQEQRQLQQQHQLHEEQRQQEEEEEEERLLNPHIDRNNNDLRFNAAQFAQLAQDASQAGPSVEMAMENFMETLMEMVVGTVGGMISAPFAASSRAFRELPDEPTAEDTANRDIRTTMESIEEAVGDKEKDTYTGAVGSLDGKMGEVAEETSGKVNRWGETSTTEVGEQAVEGSGVETKGDAGTGGEAVGRRAGTEVVKEAEEIQEEEVMETRIVRDEESYSGETVRENVLGKCGKSVEFDGACRKPVGGLTSEMTGVAINKKTSKEAKNTENGPMVGSECRAACGDIDEAVVVEILERNVETIEDRSREFKNVGNSRDSPGLIGTGSSLELFPIDQSRDMRSEAERSGVRRMAGQKSRSSSTEVQESCPNKTRAVEAVEASVQEDKANATGFKKVETRNSGIHWVGSWGGEVTVAVGNRDRAQNPGMSTNEGQGTENPLEGGIYAGMHNRDEPAVLVNKAQDLIPNTSEEAEEQRTDSPEFDSQSTEVLKTEKQSARDQYLQLQAVHKLWTNNGLCCIEAESEHDPPSFCQRGSIRAASVEEFYFHRNSFERADEETFRELNFRRQQEASRTTQRFGVIQRFGCPPGPRRHGTNEGKWNFAMQHCHEVPLNEFGFRSMLLMHIARLLRGAWAVATIFHLRIQRVSFGSRSYLCCVRLSSRIPLFGYEPRQVLVRFFLDPEIMPGHVQILEAIVFTMLPERYRVPRLYGYFDAGRLEEWIPQAVIIDNKTLPLISDQIARNLADIHRMTVPIRKEPSWIWEKINEWINILTAARPNAVRQGMDQYTRHFINFDSLADESKWLENLINMRQPRVVFCHNNLTASNILLRPDVLREEAARDANSSTDLRMSDVTSKEVVEEMALPGPSSESDEHVMERVIMRRVNASITGISTEDWPPKQHLCPQVSKTEDRPLTSQKPRGICSVCHHMFSLTPEVSQCSDPTQGSVFITNFEHASYNYQCYDLANFFNEWMFEYQHPHFPFFNQRLNAYPSPSRQRSFIQEYLRASNVPEDSISQETETLMKDMDLFSTMSHLFWALWGVHHFYFTSNRRIELLAFFQLRIHLYEQGKKKVLRHFRLTAGLPCDEESDEERVIDEDEYDNNDEHENSDKKDDGELDKTNKNKHNNDNSEDMKEQVGESNDHNDDDSDDDDNDDGDDEDDDDSDSDSDNNEDDEDDEDDDENEEIDLNDDDFDDNYDLYNTHVDCVP